VKKARLKILLTLISVFVFIQTAFLVLIAEKNKKLTKLQNEITYYQDLVNSFGTYKSEFDKQISDVKKNNLTKISEAKQQYEDLLKKQPELIAQHTSVKTQVTPNSNTSTNTTPVSNIKPSSKPKTRTS
jgi:hypothetical protein